MPWIDLLFVAVFAIAYPLYSIYDYRRFLERVNRDPLGARPSEYRVTMLWLWGFTLTVLTLWAWHDLPWDGLGLEPEMNWPTIVGLLISMAALAYTATAVRGLFASPEDRQTVRERLGERAVYLPHTPGELRLWIPLSLTAGICEEILYRGYLIWLIGLWMPTVASLVVAALLFGLLHAYQGWSGILSTTVIGLVLGGVYMLTGSLWIPVLLHVLIDIYAGLLGYASADRDGLQS